MPNWPYQSKIAGSSPDQCCIVASIVAAIIHSVECERFIATLMIEVFLVSPSLLYSLDLFKYRLEVELLNSKVPELKDR